LSTPRLMSSSMLFIGAPKGIVGIRVSCEETCVEVMPLKTNKGCIVSTFCGNHQQSKVWSLSGSLARGFRIQRMWRVSQKWPIDPHLRELSIDWKIFIIVKSGSSHKVHECGK
jgi:hypothetical protein